MFRTSLLVLSLVSLPAAGAEVDARAVTLLTGRPDVRDGTIYTVVPIYEMVSLNARRLEAPGFDDVRVVVSLWGRLDPGDPADGDLGDGDVDLGYVEGSAADGALRLRVGRQIVFPGAAGGLGLDGGLAEGRLGPAGLQIYGGVPVTPRFGVDRGDGMWGGRVSLRRSVDAEVGLSYVHILDDGRLARLDLGADGRLALSRRLVLTALGLMSAAEMRLAEARVAASWQPRRDLDVSAEAARTAPDLFLSRASILSVFSEESRDEAGVVVGARPRVNLRLRGGYHLLGNEAGLGHRAELVADADVARGAVAGVECGLLELPDDGYLHGRLFGRVKLARRWTSSLDGDLYRLDDERNGTRWSLRGALSLRYDPAASWRAVVTAVAGSDPLYETRWELMAKLAFTLASGGRR